jgi:hypothetical protein
MVQVNMWKGSNGKCRKELTATTGKGLLGAHNSNRKHEK